MHRGYVNVREGQIHYRSAGDSGPLLFCLHESPLSSWEFERTLPLLGERCRAIALDTPGYGASDPPARPVDIAGYAERLLEAIETISDGADMAFAAVHTGSSIALELITAHLSSRTTHAVFSGIPMIDPNQRETFLKRIGKPRLDADGDFLQEMWSRRRSNWGQDTEIETVFGAIAQEIAAYPKYHWAFEAVFSYDVRPALAKLRCPVYVLNAEGDSLASIDQQAVSLIQNARLKLAPGVGGQLPYRAPEVYAREVLDFIGA